jgi:hypothetical protein
MNASGDFVVTWTSNGQDRARKAFSRGTNSVSRKGGSS